MIGCVVCGVEHSGTTLVSDLLRQIPHVDAGFEVGVLLARSPRSFPALAVHAEITRWGWGIDDAAFAHCCDTDSLHVFYARLQAASPVIAPDTTTIFDKTPRYLAQLQACMARIDVQFFVTYKDPRAIVFSDWRKAGGPPFDAWFDDYLEPKLGYLRLLHANAETARLERHPQACLIGLESLCLETRATCERLYAHIGQEFRPGYMHLQNVRWENTRNHGISAGIAFEYLHHLDRAQLGRITAGFAALDRWFYA